PVVPALIFRRAAATGARARITRAAARPGTRAGAARVAGSAGDTVADRPAGAADAQPLDGSVARRFVPREVDAPRADDLDEVAFLRPEADLDARRGRRLVDAEEPLALVA